MCTPPRRSGVTRVTYARFPTPKAALAYYGVKARSTGRDTETDCADLTESESPFHTTSGQQGRLTCTVIKHRSTLTWVDRAVVATAIGDEDEPVYTWWEHQVGRTLTDTQQALLAQLPGGFSRSTCRDNGDASLKCWPLDEEDVYAVYFTQYADADALAAAYDDLLSDAGLGRDVPPPNGDASTCSFETFWGPDKDGVVTDHLGRIACIEQSDSTALGVDPRQLLGAHPGRGVLPGGRLPALPAVLRRHARAHPHRSLTMTSYAAKLTKTAASVLDGEQFVAAIKCFPQGHTGRKMGRASLLGAVGAYSVARGKQDDHAIDGEQMPLELAIGLTETARIRVPALDHDREGQAAPGPGRAPRGGRRRRVTARTHVAHQAHAHLAVASRRERARTRDRAGTRDERRGVRLAVAQDRTRNRPAVRAPPG